MSETYDAAMEAFQGALGEEGVEENQPTEQGGEVEPNQQAEPASRDIDISHLPEEAQIFIRARERELQGDYTRKTQEVAEQRREAENAINFLNALNSDPNFAMQVLDNLNRNLAAAGYQVGGFDQPYDTGQDDWGYEEQGYEPDPYSQELAAVQQRQEALEQRILDAQVAADVENQLATIQRHHPDWTDADIQAVINYGFATNGDLYRAAEMRAADRDAILASYIQAKGSVNTPAPERSTPGQQVPEAPQTEKEVHAAAREYVMRQLNG